MHIDKDSKEFLEENKISELDIVDRMKNLETFEDVKVLAKELSEYCSKEKEEKDIEELVQDDDGDIQMDMNQDDDGENNEQGEEEQEGNNEEAGVIDFTFLNFSFYQFVLGVILCSN